MYDTTRAQRLSGLLRRGSSIAFLLFCPAIVATLAAQNDAVDRLVQDYMTRFQVPGVAIAILERGRVVKARGYGLANIEHQVPVTPATVFQSASVGKQFAAAEILLLAQDGKLALDDSIGKYLKDIPETWRPITIRHVLTHTSGIGDYGLNGNWLDWQRNYSEADLLKIYTSHPLLFKPGDDWAYSNPGYTILGMIIRSVTGAHWGVYLKERIFDPLGMTTARVISEQEIVPNRSAGYEVVRGIIQNQAWVAPSLNTVAEGSLYLTIDDLAKWDAALYGDSLLSAASKRAMWTAVHLNDGATASHGMGWFLQEEPGRRAVESDGEWQGFKSYIGRYLDDSLTVIVLGNSNELNPMMLGHRIAALVRPHLGPPKLTAIQLPDAQLAEYVGKYRTASGTTWEITRAGTGLDVALEGNVLAHVEPSQKDVFFNPNPLEPEPRVLFVRNASGKITWLRAKRAPSWPERALRIQP